MRRRADSVHTQNGREIWITRGHLAALGTATLAIALLAFFIGIQVGRNQADTPQELPVDTLLPDPDKEDALEALLREVEAAQAAAPPLAFPDTLTEGEAPKPPEEPKKAIVETEVEPVPETKQEAPPPAPSTAPVPTSGWSVQVASYDNAPDADARVEKLRERDLKAYRVTALIRGKNWHRVKVGSYPSKDAAAKARNDLARILGTRDLMITEAP
jgi:cell division septation protein DedD